MSKVRGDAAVTVVLAVALLIGLVVRDELPTPPTPTPPVFVVDMDGASIGSEVNDNGTFWTIDGESASILVANTTVVAATAAVSLRLADGPCGSGTTVSFQGPGLDRTVRIPPGDATSVALPGIEVPALGRIVIELRTDGPPCEPLATDPRAIYYQVFALSAEV